MSEQCSRTLRGSGRYGSFNRVPCKNKATVQYGDRWYCSVHSPEGVAKRNERLKAERDAKTAAWESRFQREAEQRKRDEALRAFCEGVDTETIQTLTANGQILTKWMSE